jgi:hypothetical protein
MPVPNAVVTIVNTNPNPDVNISTTTDNNGLVIVPKLPPDSANRYQVTASLPGYSTDGTIPEPAGAQVAVKLNPNVLAQQITSLTLSIDQVSTLYVHVVDTSGNPMPSFAVTTTGSKKTMTNPDAFKYSQTASTDASGNITLTGMEWDAYSFGMPSGYYLVTNSPYAPVALDPNSATTANLVVSTSSGYPQIASVAPDSYQTGASSASIVVTGLNLNGVTTLKLKKSGQTDITATGCIDTSTTLTCALDLTGAATGVWDIEVNRGGLVATQAGGYNVTP